MSDVFDMFGAPDLDPRLVEALQGLADAVRDVPSRNPGLDREPDLTAVSDAVRTVLDASGHESALFAADEWHRYEASFREVSRRREAWILADTIYGACVKAAKEGWPEVHVADGEETLLMRFPDYGED